MNHSEVFHTGEVTANRRLVRDHYVMTLNLFSCLPEPIPGQFVMVRLKGREEIFLGRPFSLYQYEASGNKVSIEILYRVVGKGTRLLSHLRGGDLLEIFGPHGRPFHIDSRADQVILIAGGVGVAPISYLASYLKKNQHNGNEKMVCYLGATMADTLLGMDRLKEVSPSVHISTDDGSVGYHGTVTECFTHDRPFYDQNRSVIFACGPAPMLKHLSEVLRDHPIPCQVLLEQRMACGIGACLGCAVEVKGAGQNAYARVCKEGPVFNIQDVIWE